MNKIFTQQNKKSGIARPILVALIMLILSAVFLISLVFIKVRSVYVNVLSSRQELNYALEFVANGDFSRASESAKRASDGFIFAGDTIRDLQKNFFIKNIKFLSKNIKDFEYLAQSAQILSSSAERAIFIIQDVEDVFSGKKAGNFLEFTEDEKLKLLKSLYESYPEMQGIKANIDLSLIYLDRVNDNKIIKPYLSQINSLKDQLSDISKSLEKVISLSGIIPILTGYPEAVSYLIVLQNSNELRPTGGFIGTYGILEIKLGDIVKLETHDIYHLDMPASLNKSFYVEAPEPIKKYLGVDRWFMRDANWSPDWPSSAKNLLWFYQEEMKAANRSSEMVDFSGVIAITPRLISDLLYMVGEIEIDNNVYNKDNFIDILQYEVEMAFREDGISEWDRKLVIGDILKEMKIRLFNLSSDRWMELLDLFAKNINEKNIQVYLDDEYSRNISTNLNWGGELKPSLLDYLMVVDANLAAFKTDRVMDKKIKYILNQESSDSIKARVELSYKNNGWFDWQTTRYRTFTRVYAPNGSKLIKSSGSNNLEAISSSEENIFNPKTYFANFFSIEPGRELLFSFEYYLPREVALMISDNDLYSFYLQKQAGNNVSSFQAEFNFLKDIKSVTSSSDFNFEKNKLFWSNSLNTDQYLEVKF